MKRKLAIVSLGAIAAWMVWLLSRPYVPEAERVGFIGFTNGPGGPWVTAVAPLSTTSSIYAKAIQVWLAAGTNCAMLAITNRHREMIEVFPLATFKEQRGYQQETLLFLGTNWTGYIGPGQVAMVLVAVLPHQGPWKVELDYVEVRASLFTRIRARLGLPPPDDGGGKMESDWIEP